MTIKDTIASCLIIALGTILALHFTLFWLYGGVFIHESNKVILTIETAMSAAIIVFGMERLVASAISSQPRRSISSHRAPAKRYAARPAASTALVADSRATLPGYAAAIAVTSAASPLLGGDTPDEYNCTQATSDSTECGSPLMVRLPQTEHEPTVDTGSAPSLTPR